MLHNVVGNNVDVLCEEENRTVKVKELYNQMYCWKEQREEGRGSMNTYLETSREHEVLGTTLLISQLISSC